MTVENYGLGTRALHAGQEPDPTSNSRAVPIYATTWYVLIAATNAFFPETERRQIRLSAQFRS